MKNQLVLSLFPGIGLLDMAFEEAGFCVVRGPDKLWGGDIKKFHPIAGRFDGIIGGPPCQHHSRMAHLVRAVHGEQAVAEDLIPEFIRCIEEAQPQWFVMENVPAANEPVIAGYTVQSVLLNNRWFGGIQHRERRISFGIRDKTSFNVWKFIEVEPFEAIDYHEAVLARGINEKKWHDCNGNYRQVNRPKRNKESVQQAAELQGLSSDFLDDTPFTVAGKQLMIGNGVPLPPGRAIAATVGRLLSKEK